MQVEDVRKRLEAIDELPALPTIIAEINTLLSSAKTSAPQLSKVIMRDPSITAKVLKIANSAFFGMPKQITSVNQAIVALGFNTVRSIVLCTSVMDVFAKTGKGETTFQHREFWKHSVGVAAAARVIARNAGVKKTETSFVSGLLAGIGKIVLDEYFHDEFNAAFLQARKQQRTLWEVERELIGVSDCEVGGVILELWKLSPDLIQSVKWQENPAGAPEENQQAAAINLIATTISRIIGIGATGEIKLARITPEAAKIAGVEEVHWPRLLELTVDEAKKAAIFFE